MHQITYLYVIVSVLCDGSNKLEVEVESEEMIFAVISFFIRKENEIGDVGVRGLQGGFRFHSLECPYGMSRNIRRSGPGGGLPPPIPGILRALRKSVIEATDCTKCNSVSDRNVSFKQRFQMAAFQTGSGDSANGNENGESLKRGILKIRKKIF